MFKLLIITRASNGTATGIAQTLVEFESDFERQNAVANIKEVHNRNYHMSILTIRL